MKYKTLFISLLFLFISFLSIDKGYFASIVALMVFWGLGNLIVKKLRTAETGKDLSYIFNLAFSVYIFYMILINTIYVQNPYKDFFVFSDQNTFYFVSSYLSKSDNILSILKKATQLYVGEVKSTNSFGAFFFFGTVGYFAEMLGGNNIIIQKLTVVFADSIIPLFLYLLILKLKIDKRNVRKATLFYVFFSFDFFYSALLLRDVFILLFYIIAMYIIVQKFSLKNFFFLLLLFLLSFSFRMLSGLFFLVFLVIYLLKNFDKPQIKYLSLLMLFIIFISLLPFIINIVKENLNIAHNFKIYSEHKLGNNALRLKLEALPVGIKQIAQFGFSQIQPFPFWGYLGSNNYPANIRNLFRLPEALAGVLWFYSWGFAIFGIMSKNIQKSIPKIYKTLFYITIIYILLNTVEYTIRRTMVMYPAIYFIAVSSFYNMNRLKREKVVGYVSVLYVLMTISYLIIKI